MFGLTNVFKWNGVIKPIGGGFIGTPVELDMALFTVCTLIRSGDKCPGRFGDKNFNIEAYILTTSDGRQHVGSAFPDFD